jgi:histidine ammonia-lyase
MNKPISIDGSSLTLDEVLSVALEGNKVVLDSRARERVNKSRNTLERLIESGQVMYGVNTGFGRFAEIIIPRKEIRALQKNIVLSHAAGVGEPLPEQTVRAVMLLKANALAAGFSGVRCQVIETLVEMLNGNVHPVIPSQGSVGASGDLAPLAHMTLVVLGLGRARYQGREMAGKRALAGAGITPLELEAKEGLALLNGTQVMAATGVMALHRADTLFRSADAIAALTVEALSGNRVPYDPRIHKVRCQKGQEKVAANMRMLLEGSEILRERPVHRVQEPYSQRCIPQVHGAGRDGLEFVRSILERELNGVTDNPLVFDEAGEVLSGGNFHGEPLALAMDVLAITLCSLAGISERRIAYMMDGEVSGLPGFLSPKQGVCSGFMIAQVSAASLVSDNKGLAHPASADSVPTSANQEDYVSMGMGAALKCIRTVENAERVLAIELMCSAQGVDMRRPLLPSPPLQTLHRAFRQMVKPLDGDRVLSDDIEKAADFIRSRKMLHSLPKTLHIE